MKKPYLNHIHREELKGRHRSPMGQRVVKRYEEAKALKLLGNEIDKALMVKEVVDFLRNTIHFFEGWKSLKKTPPNEK